MGLFWEVQPYSPNVKHLLLQSHDRVQSRLLVIFAPVLHEIILRDKISKMCHACKEMGGKRKILKFLKYGRENKPFIQIHIHLKE